ncbi:MAG: redox-sensing transcriptional repressor Rex [Planctomycetota bacterium]|nr:redox-sensing transcriptional repressor Rex [Planctomycetota bacterium]
MTGDEKQYENDKDRLEVPQDSVPKAVVSRLSLYQRELQRLIETKEDTVSSNQLGQLLGISDAQVRKDLAYFGQFGHPGIGYRCAELVSKIRQILGTDQDWSVAIIGVGNLGRALLGYRGLGKQGFRVVAAFDADRSKVGATYDSVKVRHTDELATAIPALGIRLAVLTVPATEAQSVADQLVAAGIDGILNFAPVTLQLPTSVNHVTVDLAIQLEQVCFAVVNREATS